MSERLSPVERDALWAIGNGQSVPRPVRRRLAALALIDAGALTATGLALLAATAPACRWNPPRTAAPDALPRATRPRILGGMAAAMLVAATLPPSRR